MELPTWLISTLLVLGGFQLFKIFLTFFQGLGFMLYSSKDLKRYGSWVVVTGATDGIGLGYAETFAKKGFNVVLVSRSLDKLKEQESNIKSTYKVQVLTVEADFSSTSPDLYNSIARKIEGLDIAVLVNNVGISYNHAQYFDKLEDDLIDKLININVYSLTKMTKIVLPGMLAKKKGVIVNVGSAAGIIPVGDPLYSVYSGTKAYVDFFSKSMNLELKSKGVIVENHVPYFVTSKLSKIRKASLLTPNPRTYASAAVAKIGYAPSFVPYWAHALENFVAVNAPTFITSSLVLSHHLDIYKRAMKKAEKGQ